MGSINRKGECVMDQEIANQLPKLVILTFLGIFLCHALIKAGVFLCVYLGAV